MDIKPESVANSQPARIAGGSENAELVRLRQVLGPVVEARVLQVVAPDSPAQTMEKLWSLLLEVRGFARPIQVDWKGDSLPPGLQAGTIATLSVAPSRGLTLLNLQSAPQQSIALLHTAMARSLVTWLPLQTDLLTALQTLQSAPTDKLPVAVRGLIEQVKQLALPVEQIRNITLLATRLAESSGSLERTLLTLLQQRLQSTMPVVASALSAAAKTSAVSLPPAQPLTSPQPTNSIQSATSLTSSPPLTITAMSATLTGTATGSLSAGPSSNVVSDFQSLLGRVAENVRSSAGESTGVPLNSKATPGADKPVSLTSGLTNDSAIQKGLLASSILNTQTARTAATETPLPTPASGMTEGSLKALGLLAITAMLRSGTTNNPGLPASWADALQWLDRQITGADTLRHPLQFPQTSEDSRQRDSRNADTDGILKALLQLVSRLQVHQLNSSQQTLQQAGDTGQTQVWLAELPVQSNNLHTIQMRFERERQPEQVEDKRPRYRWTIVLAFNFEDIGHFQTRMLYSDGTVSATLWAEQQQTLRLIHENLPHLRDGLKQWGLTVGGIEVRHGQPPVPSSPVQRQMIDERA